MSEEPNPVPTSEPPAGSLAGVDPDARPFEAQAVAGIPFGRDSEEAEAIRAVLSDSEEARTSKPRPWYHVW